MEITLSIIHDSVAGKTFGTIEPFITGDEKAIAVFYEKVLSAVQRLPNVSVRHESDHHGSGYASYISVFLYPSDGSSCQDYSDVVNTTGILLYLSRLAPIAIYGASFRTDRKNTTVSTSGFIEADNAGLLPEGNWLEFIESIISVLHDFDIEIITREVLLNPAPEDIVIPTVFDGPYYVLDTLFYWSD